MISPWNNGQWSWKWALYDSSLINMYVWQDLVLSMVLEDDPIDEWEKGYTSCRVVDASDTLNLNHDFRHLMRRR